MGEIHLTSFKTTLHVQLSSKNTGASSRAWECVYIEVTHVLEIKARNFSPLPPPSQVTLRIKDSNYLALSQDLDSQASCTLFFHLIKNQPCCGLKRPKFKGEFGNYCASALFWREPTVREPTMNLLRRLGRHLSLSLFKKLVTNTTHFTFVQNSLHSMLYNMSTKIYHSQANT